MSNLLAILILAIAYLSFGLWHLSRQWRYADDLDAAFFISIIPVAIATWIALHLVGA